MKTLADRTQTQGYQNIADVISADGNLVLDTSEMYRILYCQSVNYYGPTLIVPVMLTTES